MSNEKQPDISRHRRSYAWPIAAALAVIPIVAIAAPANIPHQFEEGQLLVADQLNENFDALAMSIDDNDTRLSNLESALPQFTVRKSTGSRETAVVFCQNDEILTGGGCFMPPENRYDPDYSDYGTYYTGNFPRAMVGITSVPVPPGTSNTDMRPMSNIGGSIIPFDGDIIGTNTGSVASPLGGGWGCRAGIVQHDDSSGANSLVGNIYEQWYFHVKAYAICMET